MEVEDKIDLTWYQSDDVTRVAKLLLGKVLCTQLDGVLTKGIIVETEAYSGFNDKACHANNQRKTNRNAVMFDAGGKAYIYLCYGLHHLVNVVTNVAGRADAVLIRALQPLLGIDEMLRRRNMSQPAKRLTAGPGVLSKALGITTKQYGVPLDGNILWIEDAPQIADDKVVSSTRIGVEYAEEDALKPWRFYIKENPWVSKY
ncbi:MAG: DNA-3-methyladenine glycosylase [Cyclobacteriaceae bacterium]|nr:DNA-3-methyladenine glycosylase [Cyclobacteriaceae bacterium]